MRRFLAILPLVILGLIGPQQAVPFAGASAVRAPAAALPKPVRCKKCYRPALRTGWQWQLSGKVNTSVPGHLFDIDGFEAKRGLVRTLHAKHKRVVCYISAGSWESWRPDAGLFPASVKGRSNGWPGERWLDIRNLAVLGPIMDSRLDMCRKKGFDAVEFDNVDGYTNNTGFPLTAGDQAKYNVFLANEAHLRGMSAVLKNDVEQVKRLLPYFDFALNEQCFQYSECAKLKPFVKAGKAVFGVEYSLPMALFCPRANAMHFNFLRKHLSLGVWRRSCR